MNQDVIFLPVISMWLLTMVVWVYLYIRRLTYMTKNKIEPHKVNSPSKLAAAIPAEVNSSASNYNHLFEAPVIFYVVCIYLYVTGSVDAVYLYAAYGFAALRAVHSIIQCTYNKVMHRFAVFMLSSVALWFMVLRIAVKVLAA